ncbi:hypothetical protein N0V83_000071 [Neocucurbitaria cava]|uniref:Uncharacterized protein n=1 Tax=Neocucurbitaria cava TaxID=798079 RepID=A0A9W8YHZ4_9PLEO|nr:hypothetical protein N0V83_000071 [Neocucurbitaria cava]
MDHWGDPWADNNGDDKSTAKHEVASPLPPTHASVPVLLNGFLDDAGWGNEDESFGDWTASTKDIAAETAEASRVDLRAFDGHATTSDDAYSDTAGEKERPISIGGDNWPGVARDDTEDLDNVLSETSDSSTTIEPSDAPEKCPVDASDSLQPDDSSSTRLSTSPSETSHFGVSVESPRTSVEEDRGAGAISVAKAEVEEDKVREEEGRSEGDGTVDTRPVSGEDDDEFGTFAEEAPDLADFEARVVSDASKYSEAPRIESEEALEPASRTTTGSAGRSSLFTIDLALLDTLFPPPGATKDLEAAPDDPIYSTTGRKAWYRLTRKQTLREFNIGTADDNHIRVTWANSDIRSDVNKIVGRWAREDRLSGTGPGARASFYWDTPAPVASKTATSHSRTQSSLPAQRAVVPVRQSLPPLSTNTPAAFNWSSPSAAIDPWAQHSPRLQSLTSPIAQKHATARETRQHNDDPMSVELPPQEPIGTTKQRSFTPLPETPIVADPVSPPPTSTAHISSPDPWADISSLDKHTSVDHKRVTSPVDDDDDWGEMVSSPTVSTPTATAPTSHMTSRDNTLSTPSSTPNSVKASSAQESPADAMHAASIVRLQGMISPTSAIFGPKSYVPRGIEQGPVGPGILKPVKRDVPPMSKTGSQSLDQALSLTESSLGEKAEEQISQVDGLDEAFEPKVTSPEPATGQPDDDDDFSAFTCNTVVSGPPRPCTPPPPSSAIPAQPTADSWADADFSFFESALPPTTTAPPVPSSQTTKHVDPSDPFSVFEQSTPRSPPRSPPRSSSAASSAKTFTRSSPPRDRTPPPLQPLTGATNAAQLRKAEEEEIIRGILEGLPDLGYMLR